jgi:hypothetical protein
MLKTTHSAQAPAPVKAPDYLEHSAAEQGIDLIRADTCPHRALMPIYAEAGTGTSKNPTSGDKIRWRLTEALQSELTNATE